VDRRDSTRVEAPPVEDSPQLPPRSPPSEPPPIASSSPVFRPKPRYHVVLDLEPFFWGGHDPDIGSIGYGGVFQGVYDLREFASLHVEGAFPIHTHTGWCVQEVGAVCPGPTASESAFRLMTGASIHSPPLERVMIGLEGSVGVFGEVTSGLPPPYMPTTNHYVSHAAGLGPAADVRVMLGVLVVRPVSIDLGLRLGFAYMHSNGDPDASAAWAVYVGPDLGLRFDVGL